MRAQKPKTDWEHVRGRNKINEHDSNFEEYKTLGHLCVFMLASQYQKAIDKIMGNSSSSSLPALQTVASCDTSRFMGTWFVIAVKPTVFETKSSNCVEKYTFLDSGKTSHDIDIDFTYNEEAPLTSKIKALPQKGYVQGDKYNSAVWKVSPMWPIKLDYSVIELGNN